MILSDVVPGLDLNVCAGVLSDRDILNEIGNGKLMIDGFNRRSVKSNHYDFRLGSVFHVMGPRRYMTVSHLDVRDPLPKDLFQEITVPYGETFTILPDDFIIVTTRERVALDGEFMGILTGRSSIGRLGIKVHSTAAHFDRGFAGYPNLEISLDIRIPVVVYPGMRIASMIFFYLNSKCIIPYGSQEGSKYQNQGSTPTDSKLYLDWQEDIADGIIPLPRRSQFVAPDGSQERRPVNSPSNVSTSISTNTD